jgi:hypothetical protein
MSNNCTCVYPTLSPFVNGVCDKCGGKFFDQRDLLPLETVTNHTIKGEKTRILNTADNRERMKVNEKIAAKKLKELES